MDVADIVNPSTYWVGNRCYRVLSHQVSNSAYNFAEEDDSYYSENANYNDDAECGVDDSQDFNIQVNEIGVYSTSFHVPNVYFAYLIGSKGATKKRMEQEARCNIHIPPRNKMGDIVITGASVTKVRSGRLKVELLVDQARRKQRPTHFISLPVNGDEIQAKFQEFKSLVIERCSTSRGFDERLFQEAPRLHLTIGVMKLMDDVERVAAIEAFSEGINKLARKYFPQGSFCLRAQGLSYFNDDPREVSVLYANVKEILSDGEETQPRTLQQFSDDLVNHMANAGVMQKERENVKLHLTLLNGSNLDPDKDTNTESNEGWKRQHYVKNTFDITQIMENFKEFDFGIMEVCNIHFSVMHSRDAHTGYYSASRIMPLSLE